MNNILVVSPNCTSDSAVGLAELLDVPYYSKERYDNSIANATGHSKVINWGCSRINEDNILLNKPRAVRRSLNKLRTFELLSEHVRMPVMTLSKEEAKQWAEQGRQVVIRNRIKGSKSQGVFITYDPADVETMPAKFYTRFIENCTEVRVNVYKEKILTVYHKVPSNGDFRFKIQMGAETNPPLEIVDMVYKVGEHIGLDMYGLDVLLTPKGKYFLLEVNSAPILFPITMKRLAKSIKKEYENA